MSSATNPTKPSSRQKSLQFGLRSLLLIILLAALYSAGWVSHRTRHQRITDQATPKAIPQFAGAAQVEIVDNLDMMILKGPSNDVEAMKRAIDKIQASGQQ